MNTQRTFLDDLKYKFKHGGVAIQLIFANAIVFALISIVLVFSKLLKTSDTPVNVMNYIFSMNTEISGFLKQPWSLFTSIFAHYSIWHLFLNMLFLFFSGQMFTQIFSEKRLLPTYILGGVFGGVFELLANLIFPAMQSSNYVVVGASGSIMAIFFAIAFYRPNLKVNLFGVFPIRIIFLGLMFLILDFLNLGSNDGTAHFAHIGGALLGMISIQNISASKNIITRFQNIIDRLKNIFKKKSHLKVKQGGYVRRESDEDYNLRKKQKQAEIDKILDKISKSGYESLTKSEKDILFKQSKNG